MASRQEKSFFCSNWSLHHVKTLKLTKLLLRAFSMQNTKCQSKRKSRTERVDVLHTRSLWAGHVDVPGWDVVNETPPAGLVSVTSVPADSEQFLSRTCFVCVCERERETCTSHSCYTVHVILAYASCFTCGSHAQTRGRGRVHLKFTAVRPCHMTDPQLRVSILRS